MPIVTGVIDVVVVETPLTVSAAPREVAPLGYKLVGWDDTEWWLTDLGSSVLKGKGATGFGFNPVTHWWTDSPSLPGSSWGGHHDDRAELFMPIEMLGTNSADMVATHQAFARTLDPGHTSRLYVYTPDGRTRYTDLRYREGFDAPVDLDPVASLRVRYGITWDRADPYWSGETVTAHYDAGVAPTFFSVSGSVVSIGSSSVMETGTINNPGTLASQAVWTITGPVTSFTVGVAAGQLKMTPNLIAGQSIVADMRTTSDDPLSIRDQAGADRYADVTDLTFADIPSGADIPLVMSAVGTGAGFGIDLSFVAKYRSAWG